MPPLAFSVLLCALGSALLGVFVNALTMWLTFATFVGYAVDAYGGRLNLKERLFRPSASSAGPEGPLLVVVGTGMNSGKTTVVSQILHGLGRQGVRAAAAKITGSVSNRDTDEMRATDAISVLDFSDYGFPSTYLADPEELALLWRTILADGERAGPQLTVVEIADGVLERETALILRDPAFPKQHFGVPLAGSLIPWIDKDLGNGVSREAGLPVAWGEGSGVVWKCPLPEWGNSTPAIWGDAIFVTTHADDQRLLLVKVNKKTGRTEWTRQVGEAEMPFERAGVDLATPAPYEALVARMNSIMDQIEAILAKRGQ